MNAAVVNVIATITGHATETSGAVGSSGSVYSADAPSTKHTSPPTNSRPWLVTVSSSANSSDRQADQQQPGRR